MEGGALDDPIDASKQEVIFRLLQEEEREIELDQVEQVDVKKTHVFDTPYGIYEVDDDFTVRCTHPIFRTE